MFQNTCSSLKWIFQQGADRERERMKRKQNKDMSEKRGRGQEGANRLVYMLKQTLRLTGQDNAFTPHVEGEEKR